MDRWGGVEKGVRKAPRGDQQESKAGCGWRTLHALIHWQEESPRGDERTSGRRPSCCALLPMRPRSAGRTRCEEQENIIAIATDTAIATVTTDRTKDTPLLRTTFPRFWRQ